MSNKRLLVLLVTALEQVTGIIRTSPVSSLQVPWTQSCNLHPLSLSSSFVPCISFSDFTCQVSAVPHSSFICHISPVTKSMMPSSEMFSCPPVLSLSYGWILKVCPLPQVSCPFQTPAIFLALDLILSYVFQWTIHNFHSLPKASPTFSTTLLFTPKHHTVYRFLSMIFLMIIYNVLFFSFSDTRAWS